MVSHVWRGRRTAAGRAAGGGAAGAAPAVVVAGFAAVRAFDVDFDAVRVLDVLD